MRPELTPTQSLAKMVAGMETPVLLDVGSNVGQFGIDFRNSGFKGRIISYEPVKSVFNNLKKSSSKYQPWEIVNRALGSSNHESLINVSNNSGLSSSLLKISREHLQAFPDSYTTSTEVIEIVTLDSEVIRLKLNLSETILKIDVQGYESEVIEGGLIAIPQISYIILELSLLSLYENEKTFLEVLNRLEGLGHRVVDIHRGIHGRDGLLLQVDVITKSTRIL
jgi:FkbM family methyltransferase